MTTSGARVGEPGSGHEEGDDIPSGPGTVKEADVNLRFDRHEIGITADLSELAKVRSWVRTVLGGFPASVVTTAVMVVDELASNALRHGHAPYHVRLLPSAAKVRIEVDDGSGETARRRTPSDQAAAGCCWSNAVRPRGASSAGPPARPCGPSWPRTRGPMAERVDTAPVTPLTGDRGWDAAPAAAIVADGAGVVRALNEAARLLFPGVAPGRPLAGTVAGWLAEAHDLRTSEITRGEAGARFLAAHLVLHGDAVTWWLVDETDIRTAQDALAHEQERTAFLSEASAALLGSLNLERCMEVAARLAAEHLADAALVLAPATTGSFPAVTCVRGGEPSRGRLEVDPDELPGLGEALQGFPPVPSRWLDPDAAPRWLLPAGFGPVGSIVVTPLPGHGVPAGALVLLRTGDRASFSEQEELFARLFAARAGAAMSAARVFALQASITDTLMRELLPPTLEQAGGVEFAGRYRPALDGERIGGDFYDVHSAIDGDESLAVLGDVCGKGLDAAVLTGKIRTTLRALLPMAGDHQRLLGQLNATLADRRDARFVTLVLASARREGNTVRLRVTCAGHPPP